MTKKEARNFLYKKMKSYSGRIEINKELVNLIEIDELINQIYDDFENEKGNYHEEIEEDYNMYTEEKVCKNCSQYKDGKCRIFQGAKCKYTLDVLNNENFGCNRFKRKESEQNNQKDN